MITVAQLREMLATFSDDDEVVIRDRSQYGYFRPLDIFGMATETFGVTTFLVLREASEVKPDVIGLEIYCHDHKAFRCSCG